MNIEYAEMELSTPPLPGYAANNCKYRIFNDFCNSNDANYPFLTIGVRFGEGLVLSIAFPPMGFRNHSTLLVFPLVVNRE